MNGGKLTTALVGVGRIAWSAHLPAMAGNDNYRLSAVVDPLAERCREACDHFAIPRFYASTEELLAAEHPDLVVIASPTVYHAADTIAALRHGSHVFCDKPAAICHTEFEAMMAAARENSRKLMIYQPRRLCQDTADLRVIIDSGKLGRIFQIHDFVGRYCRRNDWQAFRKNGGGMLLNYGAHHVDQFIYLLGGDYQLLACDIDRVASVGDAEDVVKILLRFNGDVLVDININQAAAIVPYCYAVYGQYGAAVLTDEQPRRWHIRYYDPAKAGEAEIAEGMAAPGRKYPKADFTFEEEYFSGAGAGDKPVSAYYRNLYDYITADAVPLNPLSDTWKLMRLLDEAREKAGE